MSSPVCYGIIPARYQSHRFPGKPLVDILGKPMFYRVYERAISCSKLQQVWLATDDQRIFDAATKLNVPVVMTSVDHHSGSDRIKEAAEQLKLDDEAVIVNIQGDEPALDPSMLTELVAPFDDASTQVTTLARVIDAQEAENPDRVKVVRSNRGHALYFSRSKVPYIRDEEHSQTDYYLHIGIYAYRFSVLKAFTLLPPSPLEDIEKLEQLRLLEAGINIHVVMTNYTGFGVDRPEDVEQIIKQLQQQ
ncbi:3-deoxy-manno-octulosonate cytidylyltransferase [Desulfobulbus rhabdoformis]|jgi:3-deoxy-manno-octulosonate cytidylyltransferase (CMP-KDO synthetase)|uniref:3-deoxy-manno-octulosonate cytidylyltransferase n=1 Tax=Desulfobulbus rhabdoformis TaxID=34032 RepID=UPI001964819D|nr:3-deoxy-manno-octulosonate cytidylyltransferase [Desulfobulbus rhabdoformis]MBM9613704.1 3-deoxy-manno-octulosonate cytidylyltransferase [Desulfobulbus rhabdoformis]